MRRMAKTLEFPDDIRPDFPGFSPAAFTFLAGLAKNNDRAWFTARKDVYDSEIRFPMECLLGEFAASRRLPDFPVQGDPKRGMFRVHRDVRFAKDKSPYKTHAGAVLTRSGGKGDPGIVYIHIEPGACFLSAGFYALDKNEGRVVTFGAKVVILATGGASLSNGPGFGFLLEGVGKDGGPEAGGSGDGNGEVN